MGVLQRIPTDQTNKKEEILNGYTLICKCVTDRKDVDT